MWSVSGRAFPDFWQSIRIRAVTDMDVAQRQYGPTQIWLASHANFSRCLALGNPNPGDGGKRVSRVSRFFRLVQKRIYDIPYRAKVCEDAGRSAYWGADNHDTVLLSNAYPDKTLCLTAGEGSTTNVTGALLTEVGPQQILPVLRRVGS